MASEVSLNHSSYWTPKCISLSAVVGTVAVTAVVLGVLNLMGVTLQGAGFIGGVALSGGGGALLVILALISVIRYCRSKNVEKIESAGPPLVHQPVVIPSSASPAVVVPIRPSAPSFSPAPAPPKPLGPWEQAAQELGIRDYEADLQRRFQKTPYLNYRMTIYTSEAEVVRAQEATDALLQARLYLMSDEQLLAIPLKEIDDYRPGVMDVLYMRLDILKKVVRHPQKGTLGELRQKMLALKDVEPLSQNVKGLLTSDQIATLMADPSTDQSSISPLLPKIDPSHHYTRNNNGATLFNRSRVEAMAKQVIPHIGKLGDDRITLLPIELFWDEKFPWEQVEGLDFYFGTKIFKDVSIEKINQIAPRLAARFLEYLPKPILQSPQFEWPVWLAKKGIGAAAALCSKREDLPDSLPYNLMADYPEEAKVLLGRVFTFVGHLNLTSILKLVAILRAEDLPWSKEILSDEKFPWSDFLQKPGIGIALRDRKEISTFPETIPWELLNPEEAKALFPLLKGDESDWDIDYRLRAYKKLNARAVKKLFDVLTIGHLSLIPKELFHDKAFPWDDFLGRPGIGNYFRKSGDISYEAIPWDKLPQSEAEALFCLGNKEGHEKVRTTRLLNQLKKPALALLADKLTPDHKSLIST